MDLFTLAGASERLGCTPNRIKDWMNKGFVPDCRVNMGKHQARVIDAETLNKLVRVLEGIDAEGLGVKAAFSRYFN